MGDHMTKRGRKGKYDKWLTEENLLRVTAWARDGLTDKQIAKNMGIGEKTIHEWKKRFPAFSTALKKGKEVVDIEVENSLHKRAMGFEYEEVTTEIREIPDGKGGIKQEKHIKRTKKFIPPETTAMIYWLKNRRPDKWRDRPEPENNEAVDKLVERMTEVLNGISSVIE